MPCGARGICALSDDDASEAEIALECLTGHKFDAFNFNALCDVARYAYLKSGDWSAFYAVPNPDISAGEESYVLPEHYRLCLYGLAAVKQLKFDKALSTMPLRNRLPKNTQARNRSRHRCSQA